jgi:hypothetical protein
LKRAIAAAAVCVLSVGLFAGNASADPPGIEDVGKMLYKFNVLAVPQGDWSEDDAVCNNSGRRVFFQRTNSGPIGTITWQLDPAASGFTLTDCDGTLDKTATVLADEELEFYVFVRVHGAATDTLDLRCEDVIDVGVDNLCLIDTVRLSKGKSLTKIMWNIFDNGYEEVLWTLETTTGFRNAEVRIYERLP